MTELNPDTVARIWSVTLLIFLTVLLVVATLLTLIVVAARRILQGVGAIWVVGQKIANNTIHIALLEVTNHAAGRIYSSAVGVVGATAAIKGHAEGCPGCPACVLGHGWTA